MLVEIVLPRFAHTGSLHLALDSVAARKELQTDMVLIVTMSVHGIRRLGNSPSEVELDREQSSVATPANSITGLNMSTHLQSSNKRICTNERSLFYIHTFLRLNLLNWWPGNMRYRLILSTDLCI